MSRRYNTILSRPGIHLAIVSLWLMFASSFAASAGKGFDWDKWSGAVNADPCQWFTAAEVAQLIGTGLSASPQNSKTSSSCQWKTADGLPVLTISLKSMDSSTAVNAERDGQLAQIKNYGDGRFTEIPAEHGVTTNILRKDRLIAFLFANSNSETVFVTVSGHPVRTDTPEQKKVRKERLITVTQAIIAHFKF